MPPPARLEIRAELRLQVVDLRSHLADVNLTVTPASASVPEQQRQLRHRCA